jgi:hypothetical protein
MNQYLKEHKKWWPITPELMAIYNDGSHHQKDNSGSLHWFKAETDLDKIKAQSWTPKNTFFAWSYRMYNHRDGDKPAYIGINATLVWYKNGIRHRDGDKPSEIWRDGTLLWYKDGKRYRNRGPAVIHPNGRVEWWINDYEITKDVKVWLKTQKNKTDFTIEQTAEFILRFG